MNQDLDSIKKAFGNKLQGDEDMKNHVASVVSLLNVDVRNYITSHCWFLSSTKEAWAFTFAARDLDSRDYLIFLGDELLQDDESQIHFTIAHEIGHVVLKHRNGFSKLQSYEEISVQEHEADTFAYWLLSKRGDKLS